jgi:hypothetical protein
MFNTEINGHLVIKPKQATGDTIVIGNGADRTDLAFKTKTNVFFEGNHTISIASNSSVTISNNNVAVNVANISISGTALNVSSASTFTQDITYPAKSYAAAQNVTTRPASEHQVWIVANALNTHKNANPIDHPDSSVTTIKINDSAVTTAKINDSAVTTAKIADLNVTTAKINNSAVTTAKIADKM